LAKPNYSFDKRQRELKKAKQQEEKRQKKQAAKPAGSADDTPERGAPSKPTTP
jgi:hypothetical protein